jgi:hypothetical protein
MGVNDLGDVLVCAEGELTKLLLKSAENLAKDRKVPESIYIEMLGRQILTSLSAISHTPMGGPLENSVENWRGLQKEGFCDSIKGLMPRSQNKFYLEGYGAAEKDFEKSHDLRKKEYWEQVFD